MNQPPAPIEKPTRRRPVRIAHRFLVAALAAGILCTLPGHASAEDTAIEPPPAAATALPPAAPPPPPSNPALDVRNPAPEQAQPSVFRRWWFWTAVGAAAAVTVVVIVASSRGSAPPATDLGNQEFRP
jgi:hypothetical protein